jgi:hypothetical protein
VETKREITDWLDKSLDIGEKGLEILSAFIDLKANPVLIDPLGKNLMIMEVVSNIPKYEELSEEEANFIADQIYKQNHQKSKLFKSTYIRMYNNIQKSITLDSAKWDLEKVFFELQELLIEIRLPLIRLPMKSISSKWNDSNQLYLERYGQNLNILKTFNDLYNVCINDLEKGLSLRNYNLAYSVFSKVKVKEKQQSSMNIPENIKLDLQDLILKTLVESGMSSIRLNQSNPQLHFEELSRLFYQARLFPNSIKNHLITSLNNSYIDKLTHES